MITTACIYNNNCCLQLNVLSGLHILSHMLSLEGEDSYSHLMYEETAIHRVD